jgi:deazaflavin-dependent oxidoreductase (nitroreductase family)
MAAPQRRSTMRIFWRLHRFWYRVSGGRVGAKVAGMPVLQLTTTGHRSGEPRTVLLTYVPFPVGFAVIASNAGSQDPPAWWLNLQADPAATVSVGRETFDVMARELAGSDRDDAWQAAVRANPGYDDYRKATTREIPVVLLERAEPAMDRVPGVG